MTPSGPHGPPVFHCPRQARGQSSCGIVLKERMGRLARWKMLRASSTKPAARREIPSSKLNRGAGPTGWPRPWAACSLRWAGFPVQQENTQSALEVPNLLTGLVPLEDLFQLAHLDTLARPKADAATSADKHATDTMALAISQKNGHKLVVHLLVDFLSLE